MPQFRRDHSWAAHVNGNQPFLNVKTTHSEVTSVVEKLGVPSRSVPTESGRSGWRTRHDRAVQLGRGVEAWSMALAVVRRVVQETGVRP